MLVEGRRARRRGALLEGAFRVQPERRYDLLGTFGAQVPRFGMVKFAGNMSSAVQ